MRLENKVALVTGASSGIGNAIARLFAKEGASVVAVARRKEKLSDLVKNIKANGGNAVAVSGDVTNELDIQNAVKTTSKEFGKLDIVVNAAGISDNMASVTHLEEGMWDAVMDVNLNGTMRVFKYTLPEMEKNGGGSIVSIASIAGLRGALAGAAYTASKHGVIGLAKNVAFMYADKNIRSNVIAPGAIATDMVTNLEETSNKEGLAKCVSGSVQPRVGEADEIARLALFLASDEASLINGAVVTADAGFLAY